MITFVCRQTCATEHFPSPLQQEGEEFVFGGMEENVYTENDDDNADDDSNKPALTFTLKEINKILR